MHFCCGPSIYYGKTGVQTGIPWTKGIYRLSIVPTGFHLKKKIDYQLSCFLVFVQLIRRILHTTLTVSKCFVQGIVKSYLNYSCILTLISFGSFDYF